LKQGKIHCLRLLPFGKWLKSRVFCHRGPKMPVKPRKTVQKATGLRRLV
jgi:hypothetical protein